MTPAINLVKSRKIKFQVHEYQHDPAAESYGLEAAEKLALSPQRVFKTLVVKLDGRHLAVAVIPVEQQLNMKAMAKACGVKKAAMAEPAEVERTTGYVLGGVSPLGQKKVLTTIIDSSAQQLAQQQSTMFVSAGRRGLEIELQPQDLCALLQGRFAPLTRL